MPAERRFHAMGSDAHVIVVGGPPRLALDAERRIADLERRWSRFESDSEVSALTRHAGSPVAGLARDPRAGRAGRGGLADDQRVASTPRCSEPSCVRDTTGRSTTSAPRASSPECALVDGRGRDRDHREHGPAARPRRLRRRRDRQGSRGRHRHRRAARGRRRRRVHQPRRRSSASTARARPEKRGRSRSITRGATSRSPASASPGARSRPPPPCAASGASTASFVTTSSTRPPDVRRRAISLRHRRGRPRLAWPKCSPRRSCSRGAPGAFELAGRSRRGRPRRRPPRTHLGVVRHRHLPGRAPSLARHAPRPRARRCRLGTRAS